MADFVILVDADPRRRTGFLARARAAVPRQPGLVVGTAEAGDLAAAWAHGPRAPVSMRHEPTALELLFGHALPDRGPRLSAEELARLWLAPEPSPTALDGFFAGIVWRSRMGLAVGGDPFGLFPIYVAGGSTGLVVASTPALAALGQANATDACDPEGLAGIMLTNGLLGGRSLVPGVRRVAAGKGLRWTPGRGLEEVHVHELAPRDDLVRLGRQEADELVDDELRRAIARHRPPGGQAGIMLSGGLDSRLMAAYLATESAVDRAVTLGRPHDFEATAAGAVARTLGIADWTLAEDDDVDTLVDAAHRLALTERLAGGFAAIEAEPEARFVAAMSPEFWSGFAADDVLGGYAGRFGRDPAGTQWSAAMFLQRIGRWGLPPETVGRLLAGASGPELVAAISAAFEHDYDAAPGSDMQRSFRMKLATRVRFHIGGILHRISFHSWPLLPVLDRRLIDTVFNLPWEHVADRQLEVRLLARRGPRLLAVPRDTNSFTFEPMAAVDRRHDGLLAAAWGSLRRKFRRAYWRRWRRTEPRRYVRCFDLDAPAWRRVRLAAEPGRSRLPAWIDRPTLDRILPPAAARFVGRDPFAAGTPVRLLTGLCLLHSHAG